MIGASADIISISGLVVEYIVAIDVTRVRFPADALRGLVLNWLAFWLFGSFLVLLDRLLCYLVLWLFACLRVFLVACLCVCVFVCWVLCLGSSCVAG